MKLYVVGEVKNINEENESVVSDWVFLGIYSDRQMAEDQIMGDWQFIFEVELDKAARRTTVRFPRTEAEDEGKRLLGRLGYSTSLRIGVARNEKGKFQAHAWIEDGGEILIGELNDLDRFTVLPPLEGEGP